MTAATDHAIAAIEAAGERLALATEQEQLHADAHGPEKAAAVVRLMSVLDISATAAEKRVNEDPHFAQYRAECRASVVARIRAEAAYEAARMRAYLAVRMEVALS